MKFYRVDLDGGETVLFAGTLGEAHAAAKERVPEPVFRGEVRIHEVHMAVHQAALVALLNALAAQQRGAMPGPLADGRVWTLTARGGLKEITP